ncbi:N-terminal nucleophile aminohydrolase, partial [Laetiporus sulphureus 93-53]
NGGIILAIVGKDFTVIAGDTHQSEGYSIQTRCAPNVFRLYKIYRAVLAVNGFAADWNTFVNQVKQRLEWYRHAHAKDMSLRASARLIQTMLYARRFFPYYVYNILGGIKEDGSYKCAVQSLVQPFLDNQVYVPSWDIHMTHPAHLPLAMVIDSFTSATERHVEIGDGLEMYIVLAKGRSAQELASISGLAEITTKAEGDRMFVIKQELKD